MIIFCAGQLVLSAASVLGTLKVKSSYRFNGKKKYIQITPSTHKDLLFKMKGFERDSFYSSILSITNLFYFFFIILSNFAVIRYRDSLKPGTTIRIIIDLAHTCCMLVLSEHVFISIDRIRINGLGLDDIFKVYSEYYCQNILPLDKLLDFIGIYIAYDPKVEYIYVSITSLFTISALLLSLIFFNLSHKDDDAIRGIVDILLTLIIVVGLLIIFSIFLLKYIPVIDTTVYVDKNYSKTYTNATEIIATDIMNISFLKTKDICGFDVNNFSVENAVHPSEINKNEKTAFQESFFSNKYIKLCMRFKDILHSMVTTCTFIGLFTLDKMNGWIKNFIFLGILVCIIINFLLNLLTGYEKSLSFLTALGFALCFTASSMIDLLINGENENVEKYFRYIIFIILILSSGCCLYNIKLKNLEKRNFVEYIDGEFKKLDAKAIPMVNKDVEDIGEIEFITFDLKEGVKVGERVLINPCSIEIDMKNSIFRIKQNGEYLVPNNICKNELDRILLDKFAKGEIDWSKQFEGMELDGYDIQTVQECGERIRRILTCSSIVLRGESGCGKTTLMNIISGLHNGYYDCITVFGSNGRSVNYRNLDLDKFNQMRTVIPQSPMKIGCIPIPFDAITSLWECSEEEFFELAERLGLTIPLNLPAGKYEKLMSLMSYFSAGESARLSIFHVLMMLRFNKSNSAPTLLLADEPTGSLDDTTAKNVINLIEENTYGIKINVMHHLAPMSNMEYTEYEIANGSIRMRYN